MKAFTPLLRSLSILFLLSFLSGPLATQVVIRERVEIGRPASISASESPGDVTEFVVSWDISIHCTSPYLSSQPVELGVIDQPNARIWGGYNPYSKERSQNYSVQYDSTIGSCLREYHGTTRYTTMTRICDDFNIDVYADTILLYSEAQFSYCLRVYRSGQIDTAYHHMIFYHNGINIVGEPAVCHDACNCGGYWSIDWGWAGESGYIGFPFSFISDTICPSSPGTGAYFSITQMRDVLQHGEVGYMAIDVVDNEGSSIDPPEPYCRLELVESSQHWGYLMDLTSGRMGVVLDSLTEDPDYQDREILFYGWGKEPEAPQEVRFLISSYNGTIPPVLRSFTLLPPEVRAIPGRREIPYGDTTSLKIEARRQGLEWMEKPPDWEVGYMIVRADTFGFLYNADSSNMGTWLYDYSSRMNYASNPETGPDSTEVLIQMYINEPCYDCMPSSITSKDSVRSAGNAYRQFKRMLKDAGERRDFIRQMHSITKIGSNSTQKNQAAARLAKHGISARTNAVTSRINPFEHFGLARIALKNYCTVVESERDIILVADTVQLHIKRAMANMPPEDFPHGTLFDVQLFGSGDNLGMLLAEDGRKGTSLTGATQSLKYIAPDSITGSSFAVSIVAAKRGSAMAEIRQSDRLHHAGQIMAKENEISPRILEALKAQEGGSTCPLCWLFVRNPELVVLPL